MPNVGRDGLYDCAFLDASGNEIGLTLTRNKNRGLNYFESTDPALAQQFFTGTPGYSNLQPEREIQIGQGDWRTGFGQEYYDSDDPRRYYESTNVDGRFKNMVICGPKATAIALTNYEATITDEGLELWDDANTLTNWTKSAAGNWLTQEGTTKHGGTYSAKMLHVTQDQYVYQDISSPTKWQGVSIQVTCWAYATNVTHSRAVLEVDDGVGQTSANLGASGAWTKLTVTHAMAAGATQLRILLKYDYLTAENNVYFDDVNWEYPVHGNIKAWAEFNNEWYKIYGDVIDKLNGTYDGWTYVGNFAGKVGTDLGVFGSNLFIALGNGNDYQYMNTSEAFTTSNLTKKDAHWFGAVGTAMKMVDSATSNTVYSSVNPINGGTEWDAGTTIGSSDHDITDKVVDQAGTPIIPKADYPWYIDSSGDDQALIKSLKSEQATTSGYNTIEWRGNVYIPCGQQSLYEYSESGVVTNISPADYITNSSNFDGIIQAQTSDARYLFIAVDNGSSVEILAGHWETIAGTTSWVWHPISQITLTAVERMKSSTVGKRRLWIASTVSTESVYWIPLTAQYGNITSDSDYLFQTDGSIITPYMHADFRGDDKAFYKITLTMSGTSSTVYFEAWYQMIGGNWTDIGDFKTSPTTTAYLPVETTTSSKPTSEFIRFKFVPKTGSTSSTPVLIRYDVRAVWYPVQRDIIYIQVRVADGNKLHNELPDEDQTAASIRTAIDAWANPTVSWPRAFYPPYYETSADTKYCKLLPPVTHKQVEDEVTRTSEWVYDLQLLVVDGLTF